MPLIVTDAIVLHSFDYLESSRILKVITREAGVRSVLARGLRRSTRRFGTSLDLYVQGASELQIKVGRDLDTLIGFDVIRARPHLATHLSRFSGASVIAELTLRFAGDAAEPGLFDAVEWALEAIGHASSARALDATLSGAWGILRALGVAPTIDNCAACGTSVDPGETTIFSHPVGGVVCVRCAHLALPGRKLPPSARASLRDWSSRLPHALANAREVHAHQRLLREFVCEHLSDARPLSAFDAWERETLTGAQAVGKGEA